MATTDPSSQCFLAEWYRPHSARDADVIVTAVNDAIAVVEDRFPTRLVVAVASPDDELLYAVFQADSSENVTELCHRAGWPVDRITSGIQVR